MKIKIAGKVAAAGGLLWVCRVGMIRLLADLTGNKQ